MHVRDIVEQLRNPYPARQNRHVGDEADITHKQIALAPGIASEDPQFSLVRREAEDGVQRGGFPGAIGADEPQNAAFLYAQIDAVERDRRAEGLAQTAGFYACHGFSAPPRDPTWDSSTLQHSKQAGRSRRPRVLLPSGQAAESLRRSWATLPSEIFGVRPVATSCGRRHL